MACLSIDVQASVQFDEFRRQAFVGGVEVKGISDGSRVLRVPDVDLEHFGLWRCMKSFEDNKDQRSRTKRKKQDTFHVKDICQVLLNEIVISLYRRQITVFDTDAAIEMLSAARFLQFDALEKTCGQHLAQLSDPRVIAVLHDFPLTQHHGLQVLKTHFKYWKPEDQAKVVLQYPDLIEHMSFVTGLQLLSRNIWEEADEALRCALLKVALPQLSLFANSGERSWWLESESDVRHAIDQSMSWYVRSCKHITPEASRAFIDNNSRDISLGDMRLTLDYESMILSDRYGMGKGALTVVLIDLEGNVESTTFAVKSAFRFRLTKPQGRFLMAVDFDRSVQLSKNPEFVKATEENDNSGESDD